MAKEEPVNWQPISQMRLIASMISTSLAETREHLGTLTKAKDRPHVLDDATIDRVKQVHTEQMEFVGIYAQQISRWRAEKPSPARISELDRMETQNQHLREVTKAVLDLADELRKGTIDRVLGMSDFELGLQTLLDTPPDQAGAKPTLNIACNTLTYVFARMSLPPLVSDEPASVHTQCQKKRFSGKTDDIISHFARRHHAVPLRSAQHPHLAKKAFEEFEVADCTVRAIHTPSGLSFKCTSSASDQVPKVFVIPD